MIKVTIQFLDTLHINDEFYAQSSYETTADGRLVYWTTDRGDLVSFPVHIIRKITEVELES